MTARLIRLVLALLNVTSQPKHIAAAIRERSANAGARGETTSMEQT